MGCGIHFHIEVKLNDKWEHYSAPMIYQDYNFFGFIADVRTGDIKPFTDRQEYAPDDMNPVTKLNIIGDYLHSPQYYNQKQIKKFLKKLDLHIKNDKLSTDYQIFHDFRSLMFRGELQEGFQDIRWIMGFDS